MTNALHFVAGLLVSAVIVMAVVWFVGLYPPKAITVLDSQTMNPVIGALVVSRKSDIGMEIDRGETDYRGTVLLRCDPDGCLSVGRIGETHDVRKVPTDGVFLLGRQIR